VLTARSPQKSSRRSDTTKGPREIPSSPDAAARAVAGNADTARQAFRDLARLVADENRLRGL
jgi:hypothetical protein